MSMDVHLLALAKSLPPLAPEDPLLVTSELTNCYTRCVCLPPHLSLSMGISFHLLTKPLFIP